jgi:ubiquinone/menaquinone biosynthesis C-methylase UbiE
MIDYSDDREKFWAEQEEYHKNNTKGLQRTISGVIKTARDNNIKSVLELGCNSGGNLLRITEEFPDVRCVGIDICENAIRWGKEVENNPAELIVGSIYDLSQFKDNEFDLVFTRGVLMHINHAQTPKICKEAVRIAKKCIMHMERHAEEPIVTSKSNGIPHGFSHNFKKIYKNISKDIRAKVRDIKKIVGTKPRGGADHYILIRNLP